MILRSVSTVNPAKRGSVTLIPTLPQFAKQTWALRNGCAAPNVRARLFGKSATESLSPGWSPWEPVRHDDRRSLWRMSRGRRRRAEDRKFLPIEALSEFWGFGDNCAASPPFFFKKNKICLSPGFCFTKRLFVLKSLVDFFCLQFFVSR